MQLALPLPEQVGEVVPLTTEEAPPSTPEEQSPNLMIEGVLGELEPQVEATEARGVEDEEEGWSSTTGKDDNEGDDANDEDQINNIVDQQVEVLHKEQVTIDVKESVLVGDHREETILIIDEVQIIPPQAPVQQPPTFVKTLQDLNPYYNKFRIKRPHFSLVTPLK